MVKITEMSMSRRDAINRCCSLGELFIEHFDKVYNNQLSNYTNGWCKEMQTWYNDVSSITLKPNSKTLNIVNYWDWFFTHGSDFEDIFDEKESDLYALFCHDLLTTNDVRKSFKNILGLTIGSE